MFGMAWLNFCSEHKEERPHKNVGGCGLMGGVDFRSGESAKNCDFFAGASISA